jgi:HD-GYP domain-containing protein (c-di-GMP phosphodiesterase class II)
MDDFLTAVLNSMSTQLCVVDKNGEILAVNKAWERFALENGAGSLAATGAGANYLEICEQAAGLFCDGAKEVANGLRAVLEGRQSEFAFEYPCPSPVEQRWFLVKVSPLETPLRGAVVLHIDISAHKRPEHARHAERQPAAPGTHSVSAGSRPSAVERWRALMPHILSMARCLVNSHSAALTSGDPDSNILQVELADKRWEKFTGFQFVAAANCACHQALRSRMPVFRPPDGAQVASPSTHPTHTKKAAYGRPPFIHPDEAYICLPLHTGQTSLGCIWLVNENRWNDDQQQTLLNFAGLAAAAADCSRLQELDDTQMGFLGSLRTVDQAILATAGLPQLLALLIQQGIQQLHLEAGDLILVDPTGSPELAAWQGFRHSPAAPPRELVERVCRWLNADALPAHHLPQGLSADYLRGRGLEGERFQFACFAPVYSDQRLVGLIELFHRQRLEMSQEQHHFLDTLAGQTALALQHHTLVRSLEEKSRQLEDAYEKTIAGWSRTLDLRDDITEGHSRRVTELALLLARRLGIPEDELRHIRRGALLHDIGKTGIPDQILLKPGPLTLEEQRLMNNHPLYAYEMLAPVSFLGPSLDIPYCHHELWDGSGYPRGLHGEEIPLYARLFTIVDVYDSLVSTRHYRQAMQPIQALQYITAHSGKKFDPRITQVFLEMMSEQLADPASR